MNSDYMANYLNAIGNPLPELAKTFEEELEFLKKQVTSRSSLLDVGCGAARPAVDAAAFVKNLVGIDNDPRVLEVAVKRCENLPNARFIREDALNMGFTSKTFDVSFCTYNLIGTLKKSERQRLVNEMARVTRPLGKVINITWKQDKKTTEFLKKYYPSIGIKIFEIDESKTVTSKGTFERLSKKELQEYYSETNLADLAFLDIGPLWYAVVGSKPKGQFDDLV
ncbi:MAG: class I SAM-dependent methyltransferase [Candidatus Micrarchaeota archaeon]